jgi:hypothetical protein
MLLTVLPDWVLLLGGHLLLRVAPHALALQPLVANKGGLVATVCCMQKTWGEYWKETCAPILRAKKDQLKGQGKIASDQALAAAVEDRSGKRSGRALVNHMLNGVREPYFSQFLALCDMLEVEPASVLAPAAGKHRTALQGNVRGVSSSRIPNQRKRHKLTA